MSDNNDEAAGWAAIDAALASLYGDQEPLHMATAVSYRLGGPDPLDGISAYYRAHPVSHWHYVTFGFSELFDKGQEDDAVSGYGFELTFRLRTAAGATEPPRWVFSLLQNLARDVFKTGNVFRPGEWMTANGPIALDTDTRIRSMAMTSDPELPTIETPNGRLEFIQVVGLTLEEESAAKQWSPQNLLDALLPRMPLWITDLDRDSLLNDPALAELCALLPLRIPFERSFTLAGRDWLLEFESGDACTVDVRDGSLTITMTAACAHDFDHTMRPIAGRYQLVELPTVAWLVQPTSIRDADGIGKDAGAIYAI